jgi:hypothetical protein
MADFELCGRMVLNRIRLNLLYWLPGLGDTLEFRRAAKRVRNFADYVSIPMTL